MSSLRALFNERKSSLEQKLASVKSLEELRQVLDDEVRFYQNIEGPYKQDLSQAQATKAGKLLEDLMSALAYLDAVSFKDVPIPSADNLTQIKKHAISGSLSAFFADVVVTVLAKCGIHLGILNPVVAVVAGAAVGAGAAVVIVYSVSSQGNEVKVLPIQFQLDVDKEALCTYLEKSFEAIDRSVSSLQEERDQSQITPLQSQDYMRLVKALQGLLGALHNDEISELTQKYVCYLTSTLRTSQIVLRFYEEGMSDAGDIFDIEIDDELLEPVTIEPALVKADALGEAILRGRVQLPSSTKRPA